MRWKYFSGDPSDGIAWPLYQQYFGNEQRSTPVKLAPVGIGITEASVAECVDLWPINQGQFDVTEADLSTICGKLSNLG